MHPEELWTAPTIQARVLRTVLTPISWMYSLGWQAYLALYATGIKKPKRPHAPVVCIGNMLVGGTGKTPATLHVADVLTELGREVVISCSGYGSPASEAAKLAPSGPLKASEWGDEAALIRWLRPNIPLIVGRRRVLAAEICQQQHPNAVLLMDDGFQHLPLGKDVTIVLDPIQPNLRCLPAGPYREPRGNGKRADLVIPGAGRFTIEARAIAFANKDGKSRELQGVVCVLCALGRPKGFLAALRANGLDLGQVVRLPDHDPLTEGNLLSGFPAGLPILVTGKDWVKLRDRTDVEQFDIVIASHEVAIEPHAEFKSWLQARLNGSS